MVPQREDAAIAITVVEEVAKLEHTREDYPDCVESGDGLPETAEGNG